MMENPINPPVKKKIVMDVRDDPLDLWRDQAQRKSNRYDFIKY